MSTFKIQRILQQKNPRQLKDVYGKHGPVYHSHKVPHPELYGYKSTYELQQKRLGILIIATVFIVRLSKFMDSVNRLV